MIASNRVGEVRRWMDLTVRELASTVGISPVHLRRVEQGYVKPGRVCAERIAEALLEPVDELFPCYAGLTRLGPNRHNRRRTHQFEEVPFYDALSARKRALQ